MKNIILILGSIFLLSSCNSGNTQSSHKSISLADEESYQLVWYDEFDYTGLPDSTKWKYDTEGNSAGWGNHEAQYYTEGNINNAHVDDGHLNITAIREQLNNKEFTSARLVSKASWKYGKIEVRALLPHATGTWAAIWMMPANWTFNDGNWPDIGEIDIMEHVGHDPGVIHASAHSRDYQWQKGTQKTDTIRVPEASQTFHTYKLEWTPEVLKAYVDDNLYFEYVNEHLGESKWPYNKPFYLILNLAVGGAWGSIKGIDNNAFPQTMEVDYVRIYQKISKTD